MVDPLDPLAPVHRAERRSGRERRAKADASGAPANLPSVVAVEDEPTELPPPPPPKTASDSAAAFAAQLLGQPGQKRGLRVGKPLLDAAKSAYARTEYSGPADRRPPAGHATRKDI
jgi:hypothetical protein